MSRPSLFLDSSALFAGIVSASGAARALLMMGEQSWVALIISEQVIVETERALARKARSTLPMFREAIRRSNLRIVRNPSVADVEVHADLVRHPPDVPIVLAAMQANVDFLVTLNRRHFVDDPRVASRSGLRIGTPGDALAYVRADLEPGASPSAP